MKTFKIRTTKTYVAIILNDHLTNCAKAHSLLELFFLSFIRQHVIDQKSTSSQARSCARPPSEPRERVLTEIKMINPKALLGNGPWVKTKGKSFGAYIFQRNLKMKRYSKTFKLTVSGFINKSFIKFLLL